MVSLKPVIILFFVLICTLLSDAAKGGLYDKNKKGGILLQYFELLKYLSGDLTGKYVW